MKALVLATALVLSGCSFEIVIDSCPILRINSGHHHADVACVQSEATK